jgi:hypothetical protein
VQVNLGPCEEGVCFGMPESEYYALLDLGEVFEVEVGDDPCNMLDWVACEPCRKQEGLLCVVEVRQPSLVQNPAGLTASLA